MSSLLVILIGTVLTNTFLLMHNDEALGGDRHSGSTANAIRIAGATLVTLVLAIAFTLMFAAALAPISSDVLLLVYCICIVAIAIGLHRLTRNRLPRLRRSLASSPLLIVGNCLSLGTVLIAVMNGKPLQAILFAVALGMAFVAVLVLFVALTSRITESQVPTAFRLAPITLISAGLTALALMGFTGLVR
jgi:Na+-translocating ferredoxin:NAD+ oxidoreductase subunit A